MKKISKKKLLASFGDKYKTIEHEDGYLLYDTEILGKHSVHQYLGYFSIDGDKFLYRENYYTSVSDLVNAMNEYNQTLPFDIDIYNPMYRKHCMIEMALCDYIEGLGFKNEKNNKFILLDAYNQELCKIIMIVKEDTTSGKIICETNTKPKLTWTESEFTDLNSAIGALNSILAIHCLSINASVVNLLDKLTNSRVSSVYNKTFDIATFQTYTENAKEKAIEKLEQELKRLKGEC